MDTPPGPPAALTPDEIAALAHALDVLCPSDIEQIADAIQRAGKFGRVEIQISNGHPDTIAVTNALKFRPRRVGS